MMMMRRRMTMMMMRMRMISQATKWVVRERERRREGGRERGPS